MFLKSLPHLLQMVIDVHFMFPILSTQLFWGVRIGRFFKTLEITSIWQECIASCEVTWQCNFSRKNQGKKTVEPWNPRINRRFARIVDGSQEYYTPYDALLHDVFRIDEGYFVSPQVYPLEKVSEFREYEIGFENANAKSTHIRDSSKRQQADEQEKDSQQCEGLWEFQPLSWLVHWELVAFTGTLGPLTSWFHPWSYHKAQDISKTWHHENGGTSTLLPLADYNSTQKLRLWLGQFLKKMM